MFRFSGSRAPIQAALALILGSALLLSCQPAQPVPSGTPKPAEKAAAAPTKAAAKPVRGGTLRDAIRAEFGSLDPNTQTGQEGFYSIYEQLIGPDKDGNLTKDGLTKDWSIGADGKNITLKLREGVKFHDSTDFDAAAVKSNVDRMKDPATKSPFAEYYEAVTSVEVVDKLTLRLNLSQPDVLILARVAGGAGGLMVSPAAVKKYGQDFPRNPVGTGPFQFVEWKAGDRVTTKRFEGYWKKDKDGVQLPYLDGVVFQFITDPTTSVANLRTGQVDLMDTIPAEFWSLVKGDSGLTYQMLGRATGRGTSMNTKKAPFDNKALRQAVALALDREGIAGIWGANANTSIIHPIDKAFGDGKSEVFPSRDVAKAKAKMAEAGYPAGGVKVTFSTTSEPTGVREAEVIKANLAEIGIEAEIEALGSALWNTKVRNDRNYQMGGGGPGSSTNITVGDPGHYLGNQFHSKGSRNWFLYSNPKVDEALDKARVTYDQKARAALYQEAARGIVEDVPFVPIFVENGFAGTSKKVQNFVLHPFHFSRTGEVWLAP